MDSIRSILRAAAIAAFTVGLLLLLLNPPSLSGAGGLLTLLAGAVVVETVFARPGIGALLKLQGTGSDAFARKGIR